MFFSLLKPRANEWHVSILWNLCVISWECVKQNLNHKNHLVDLAGFIILRVSNWMALVENIDINARPCFWKHRQYFDRQTAVSWGRQWVSRFKEALWWYSESDLDRRKIERVPATTRRSTKCMGIECLEFVGEFSEESCRYCP